jgi:hypothetical protein
MVKIYIVDVDNTICETTGEDYANAKPYKERIEKINKLYDEGNTIIYQTARGEKNGDNWTDFTRDQLRKWGCKFKAVGTKQYFDFLIDDKAFNSKDFFKIPDTGSIVNGKMDLMNWEYKICTSRIYTIGKMN